MMVPTLMEIFAPELEQWKKEAAESGLQEGIQQGMQQGMQRGIEQGIQQGSNLKLISLICRKLKKGKMVATIAEELEEELEVVERICKVAEKFAPEYDSEQIYKALHERVA